VFPAPLMSTIAELGAFLARETAAADTMPAVGPQPPAAAVVGDAVPADGVAASNGHGPAPTTYAI
ncbi:MAG: hypothetical protein ABI890_09230, partial [Lapillicoccus sp.]